MRIGAHPDGDGKCEFTVWAPHLSGVVLQLVAPEERTLAMERDGRGYWRTIANNITPGTLYRYQLNGDKARPDPASHSQPHGVHQASRVIDHNAFPWQDDEWKGLNLSRMILYELHVGTFTPAGTFEAILPRLDDLLRSGINTIEIMPVAQFPGERNWGYDGVYPFAVQSSYGGPQGLKVLVNECHRKGIAVMLDVVYNHLGPEGNYLEDFAPYFTERYRTPWGKALNFDSAYSDEVRNYFVENALYWLRDFHIDGLRLDAVHAIYDMSAKTFLSDLADAVDEFSTRNGRKRYLIAESSLNDTRVIRPKEEHGFGIDAQWCDDLHHCVHTLLTGEHDGYYADFGRFDQLVKALREGYVLSGGYSQFRKRKHGNSSIDRPSSQFVVFTKNHDQIGNRMAGDRLTTMVSWEAVKLDMMLVLLSPYVPLIFMGEEYGEDNPFLYFVSHGDPQLVESVRKGRREEFESFEWNVQPPDPQSEDTFKRSRIQWEKRTIDPYRSRLAFFEELVRLRHQVPALADLNKTNMEVIGDETTRILSLRRWSEGSAVWMLFNFTNEEKEYAGPIPDGAWSLRIDSAAGKWNGRGSLLPRYLQANQRVKLRSYGAAMFVRQ